MSEIQFEEDPTAFRPMKVTASRDTSIGFEVEPITKKWTIEKGRIFLNWPQRKLFHNDYLSAHKMGLPKPIEPGQQQVEYIGELLVKFFGKGYLGGRLSISFIGMVWVDDEVTARGIVQGKVMEGDAIRLILDVWLETQRGDKVLVGTASGLVTSL